MSNAKCTFPNLLAVGSLNPPGIVQTNANAELVVANLTPLQITTGLGYTPENIANKGQPNGYVPLNAFTKIDPTYLDVVNFNNIYTVPTQADLVTLTLATPGDLAYAIDTGFLYILLTSPPTVLGNWVQINSATGVITVNGIPGPNVILGANDLATGTLPDGRLPVLTLAGPVTGTSTIGTSTINTAIAPSGVVPGIYNYPSVIEVGADGRVTNLVNGITPQTGALLQDGNSFGTALVMGTNDAFPVQIEVNTTPRVTVADAVGGTSIFGTSVTITNNGNSRFAFSGTELLGYAGANAAFYPDTLAGDVVLASSGTVHINNVLNVTQTGVVVPAFSTAGFVRNSAAGLLSGGNSILLTDLPSGVQTTLANAYVQGGNAFGGAGLLGLVDSFDLRLITNNIQRMVITGAAGLVGIGTNPTGGSLLQLSDANNPRKIVLFSASTTLQSGFGTAANELQYYVPDNTYIHRFMSGTATTIATIRLSGATPMLGVGIAPLFPLDIAGQARFSSLTTGVVRSTAGVLTNGAITGADITANSITFAQLQQIGANTVVANPTAVTADASTVALSINTLLARSTGNITALPVTAASRLVGTSATNVLGEIIVGSGLTITGNTLSAVSGGAAILVGGNPVVGTLSFGNLTDGISLLTSGVSALSINPAGVVTVPSLVGGGFVRSTAGVLSAAALSSGDFAANVVPLTALATIPAYSVLTNNTNAAASPANGVALATNSLLARNGTNIISLAAGGAGRLFGSDQTGTVSSLTLSGASIVSTDVFVPSYATVFIAPSATLTNPAVATNIFTGTIPVIYGGIATATFDIIAQLTVTNTGAAPITITYLVTIGGSTLTTTFSHTIPGLTSYTTEAKAVVTRNSSLTVWYVNGIGNTFGTGPGPLAAGVVEFRVQSSPATATFALHRGYCTAYF